MKYLYITIILFSIVNGMKGQNIPKIYDLEDINKTMCYFEECINNSNNENTLKVLCTSQFIMSVKYVKLVNIIKEGIKINLGYTKESAIKEYYIEKSNDRLVIKFGRGTNRYWFVEDAYMKSGKTFVEKGFPSLAIEYNFTDLIDAINRNEIEKYSGLAPYGKLPVEFIRKNKLLVNPKCECYIENIIGYHGKHIEGVYYLKLKYIGTVVNGKRGWLIDDFGNMKERVEHSVFVDFLLGETSKYNMNKKSSYYYMNLKRQVPKEEAKDSIEIISDKDVSVFSEPDIQSPIIGQVYINEVYRVYDQSQKTYILLKNKRRSDHWYKIQLKNGNQGWVFGCYVLKKKK